MSIQALASTLHTRALSSVRREEIAPAHLTPEGQIGIQTNGLVGVQHGMEHPSILTSSCHHVHHDMHIMDACVHACRICRCGIHEVRSSLRPSCQDDEYVIPCIWAYGLQACSVLSVQEDTP